MVQASRIPVDVVSIAEGLRSFADLVVKYPADDGGREHAGQPVNISVFAASVDVVREWAVLLGSPVEVFEWEPDVHTRTAAALGGVEVTVVHIEQAPRVLRRPSNVIEPCDGIDG